QDWGYITQRNDDIYLTVFNKPVNNLVRVKLPKAKNSRENVMIIDRAVFLTDGKPARIRESLRDKSGFEYYDIVIPESLQKQTMPFVIKINLKEISRGNRAAYQQALT
ncbi:MAG: hypothetical protein LBH72_01940, partial [Proteiniphilum sp.]|nr:hypothetical protein [Proteiniphilum sp.]